MALCLIVEDDLRQQNIVAAVLRDAGHQVQTAACGEAALRIAQEIQPEVVLLDLELPDMAGLDLLPQLLQRCPLGRVIILTGSNSVQDAVAALRGGARHYLVKPWELEELLLIVEREAHAVYRAMLAERELEAGPFWGVHPDIQELRRNLSKLATSPWTPVLIVGPTGSGKEIVARELHRLTASAGSIVSLNCAAMPRELQESELFGHEKGAFTGAYRRRRGLLELAREGTLFLDEIAEMHPSLQAKLLRFLEDHRYRRVGSEEELTAESRVVAATHRDLEERIAAGRFREDLYFRLAVVRLRLPPLSERQLDILPLAHFLLRKVSTDLGRSPRPMSPLAEAVLLAHSWPGNVRELKNRIERALVLGDDDQIEPRDLDLADQGAFAPPPIEPAANEIRKVLEQEGWVVSRAARRLGMARHQLRYRIRKYGFRRPS